MLVCDTLRFFYELKQALTVMYTGKMLWRNSAAILDTQLELEARAAVELRVRGSLDERCDYLCYSVLSDAFL